MTPGKAYLSTEEIRPLAERSDAMGVWLTLHCWGTIALAVALYGLWPNPVTFLIAVIVIGSRQGPHGETRSVLVTVTWYR